MEAYTFRQGGQGEGHMGKVENWDIWYWSFHKGQAGPVAS